MSSLVTAWFCIGCFVLLFALIEDYKNGMTVGGLIGNLALSFVPVFQLLGVMYVVVESKAFHSIFTYKIFKGGKK